MYTLIKNFILEVSGSVTNPLIMTGLPLILLLILKSFTFKRCKISQIRHVGYKRVYCKTQKGLLTETEEEIKSGKLMRQGNKKTVDTIINHEKF